MRIIAIAFLCCFSVFALSQQYNVKNNVKLTVGRILFGTGDVVGYGVNIEYCRPLFKSPHFLAGPELSFEDGTNRPGIYHITSIEFLNDPSFNSTSNIILTPKLSYYPFLKSFGKGLNITGGLSLGYSNQCVESYAQYEPEPGGFNGTRNIRLQYIPQVVFGYAITAGYEWSFKKLLVRARLDLDSYTNGDINTLVGLKTGIRF